MANVKKEGDDTNLDVKNMEETNVDENVEEGDSEDDVDASEWSGKVEWAKRILEKERKKKENDIELRMEKLMKKLPTKEGGEPTKANLQTLLQDLRAAPIVQNPTSGVNMSVVAMANTLTLYDGSSDAKDWCRLVDVIQQTAALPETMAAALAVMRFTPKSVVAIWYKFELEDDRLDLSFWRNQDPNTVKAEPGSAAKRPVGLRKALMDKFSVKLTREVINRRLKENESQKVGEKFFFWFVRLRPHVKADIEHDMDENGILVGVDRPEMVKFMLERNLHKMLWNGMRPEPRKWMDPMKANLTSVDLLLKEAANFEEGLEGIKFLSLKPPTQPATIPMAAAISAPSAPASFSQGAQGSRKPEEPWRKIKCPYCGIKGHGTPEMPPERRECRRKQDDLNNGVKRDKHIDYPCKSEGQKRREAARKAKKDAEKANGQVSAITESTENSNEARGADSGALVPFNSGAGVSAVAAPMGAHPMYMHPSLYDSSYHAHSYDAPAGRFGPPSS